MAKHEKVIRVHEDLPEDRLIMAGIDDSPGPFFTVSEVGKIFFKRSPHWVRLQEKQGWFKDLQGTSFDISRTDGKIGVRQFRLSNVENVAHALAEGQRIDGAQLTNCLLAVNAIAKVWGYKG